MEISDYLMTKKGLKDSVKMLEDELHDIGVWSIYNNDQLNEEIHMIEVGIEALKDKANL